jgi:hypothetical protein
MLYYSGLGEQTGEALIDTGLTGEALTGEAWMICWNWMLRERGWKSSSSESEEASRYRF